MSDTMVRRIAPPTPPPATLPMICSRPPPETNKSESLQEEAPEPSTKDSGERVAEGTEALVLHRSAGNVAAHSSADQADEKARHSMAYLQSG
jgi:hypothetical protein